MAAAAAARCGAVQLNLGGCLLYLVLATGCVYTCERALRLFCSVLVGDARELPAARIVRKRREGAKLWETAGALMG